MRAKLLEICAGSAGLTLRILGQKRWGVLAFQGSKWRFGPPLLMVLAERGITEFQPVLLNDSGPWGIVWGFLLSSKTLPQVIEILQILSLEHPRVVYDRINKRAVPSIYSPRFAAEYLFLQRISVNGKAVGIRDGTWRSPGYNTDSAEGSHRDTFGRINPMIPQLIILLSSWEKNLNWDLIEDESGHALIETSMLDARDILVEVDGETVIYIDPDYVNATGYPNGTLPRPDLIDLAIKWAEAGALVMISEAEPIQELVDLGWEDIMIAGPNPMNKSSFKSKKPEWVTVSPRRPQS